MIRRVRRFFDYKHASFDDAGESTSENGSLSGLLKEGYVELLGVTDPEAVNAICYMDNKPKLGASFIYEYFWSVGMAGLDPKWFEKLDKDESIVVQLIFHTKDSRFSIQEIAADLKQLPPFLKEKGIFDKLQTIRPLLDTAGKVIEAAGLGVPGRILSTISEINANTVPVDEFPWWIKTFTTGGDAGIEWHIPRNFLQYAGSRLVGTLDVYFVDCNPDTEETPENDLGIEIRAFLRSSTQDARSEELYVNPTNQKTMLIISPKISKALNTPL